MKSWLPLIGGAIMVAAGLLRKDMTTIALGGGFIGIPGLTNQTVVVVKGDAHAEAG